MDTKKRMLACHVSQREFMDKHFDMGSLDTLLEGWARNDGEVIGCAFAEGSRQHVAPPFPSDNVLVKLIGAKQVCR